MFVEGKKHNFALITLKIHSRIKTRLHFIEGSHMSNVGMYPPSPKKKEGVRKLRARP
jgi:hypothetical protein